MPRPARSSLSALPSRPGRSVPGVGETPPATRRHSAAVAVAGRDDLTALVELHRRLLSDPLTARRTRGRRLATAQYGGWGQVPDAPRVVRLPEDADDLRARYAVLLDRSDVRVLLASVAGRPVGLAVLESVPMSCLDPAEMVRISHLVVGDDARRRGLGRALVAAGLAWADELGAGTVAVAAQPADRETNRFFARLGLAPVVTTRYAPAQVLRRHLGQPPAMGVATAPLAAVAAGGPTPAARRRLRGRSPAVPGARLDGLD